jgi:hypothetical protein
MADKEKKKFPVISEGIAKLHDWVLHNVSFFGLIALDNSQN